MANSEIARRRLLQALAVLPPVLRAQSSPAVLRHWENTDPASPIAVQIGDVTPGRAVIWARSDRPSRMFLEWNAGAEVQRVAGPYCTPSTDYTGRVELSQLPAGAQVRYTVHFEDVSSRQRSRPLGGAFLSAPAARGDIRFLWSGDMCGQGWGINPDRGGIRIFETMRSLAPNFFIHSGDTIYADGPIQREVALAGGGTWRNVITAEKSKVAESLDEFRGAYRYNLMDENVRRFSEQVPQVWQWDDHEVTNNWSPSKDLSADARYQVKSVPLLVARATRAFLDYAPISFTAAGTPRIYRKIPYGPLLDVFVIDQRSFRAGNGFNRQDEESAETAFLGAGQREWLKHGLRSSKALWKVIASDMPIGLQVGDGRDAVGRPMFENLANGDGPPLGRELEIADLLRFLKTHNVRNTVWLTADTHYTAAHYYDPVKAQFTDFLPFWEFMSGPLNAGTFGPSPTDDTFGIQVVYQKHPPEGQANLPPSAGLQFFGDVRITAATGAMTVTLRDLAGAALFTKEIAPA
jgi:alkaline phosphatase D